MSANDRTTTEHARILDCAFGADGKLFADFIRFIHNADAKRAAWIAMLRRSGVRAAHPDDDFVDPAARSFHPQQWEFNDGARIGDVIALGNQNIYRLVRITWQRESLLSADISFWGFEELSADETRDAIMRGAA